MPLEIIAEIHPQHGGSLPTAREMIRAAKAGSATVAKFQLYDATAVLGPEWAYLEISRDELGTLKGWCDEEEIEFMVSVFDEERVGWCEDLGVSRYKIASRTVADDPALCRTILELGKETLISLGMWHGTEMPFGQEPTIRYLYCKSNYPTLLGDLHDFPDDFGEAGLAGYSDHTLGIDVCLLAIARGATIVEKHFTLDKTRTTPTERAHVCSMLPPELAELSHVGSRLYRTRRALDLAAARASG